MRQVWNVFQKKKTLRPFVVVVLFIFMSMSASKVKNITCSHFSTYHNIELGYHTHTHPIRMGNGCHWYVCWRLKKDINDTVTCTLTDHNIKTDMYQHQVLNFILLYLSIWIENMLTTYHPWHCIFFSKKVSSRTHTTTKCVLFFFHCHLLSVRTIFIS